jgi:ribosomal-protein-alanine N-acetyltransferase
VTDPIHIRAAALTDVEALLSLASESQTAAHWTREQYEDLLDPYQARGHFALLAENNSRVLGFVVVGTLNEQWEIENIVVDAARLQKGLGTDLVRAVVMRARELGVVEIDLEVRESNHAALGLYQKAGFRECGRRKGYYQNPVEDAVLYSLEVLPAEAE